MVACLLLSQVGTQSDTKRQSSLYTSRQPLSLSGSEREVEAMGTKLVRALLLVHSLQSIKVMVGCNFGVPVSVPNLAEGREKKFIR